MGRFRSTGRVPIFPLRRTIQFLKKSGKRNSRAIRVANNSVSLGSEAGDGESHGDAMVAAGIDFGAAQLSGATAENFESVRALFDRVAKLDAFFGVGAERGEHGEFIDHQRNLFAGDHAAL